MKSSCTVCGKHIEYEAVAAGAEIACPHCGKMTRLPAYSAAPPPLPQPMMAVPPPPASKSTGISVLLAVVIAVAVIVPIVGLLAAIAIPNFIRARHASMSNACVSNLRMIQGAKETWALENKKLTTDQPNDSDLFGETSYMRAKPVCPAGGIYTIGTVGQKAACTVPGHQL